MQCASNFNLMERVALCLRKMSSNTTFLPETESSDEKCLTFRAGSSYPSAICDAFSQKLFRKTAKIWLFGSREDKDPMVPFLL
jgi:hypothetical protein